MFNTLYLTWDSGNIWGHQGDDTWIYLTLNFNTETGLIESVFVENYINDDSFISIDDIMELDFLKNESLLESEVTMTYLEIKSILEKYAQN